MKHMMLDCYGSTESKLDDVKYINNMLNHIAYEVGVITVAPPFLLPYYYGVDQSDMGVSAFLFLKGGHITIHTFPLRECYFVDMVYDGEYDVEKAYGLFKRLLPFEVTRSSVQISERKVGEFRTVPVNPDEDFGPHIFARIKANKEPSMENVFEFLEDIIYKVNMTPIIRPYVIKDVMNHYTYLSGMVMIAESHISFHYNYNTGIIYFDLFSCKMFDYSILDKLLKEEYGELLSYVIIPRGTKHKYNRVSSMLKKEEIYNSAWKKNITE